MARTAQIHYERITLSLPAALVKKMRQKIEKNKMSQYVAAAIEENLEKEVDDVDKFFEELAELSKNFQRVDKRNSLEILREIRYGKK